MKFELNEDIEYDDLKFLDNFELIDYELNIKYDVLKEIHELLEVNSISKNKNKNKTKNKNKIK